MGGLVCCGHDLTEGGERHPSLPNKRNEIPPQLTTTRHVSGHQEDALFLSTQQQLGALCGSTLG
jgi:hypothetical protein